MRIGLFSDYYLAQSDGTAIATEISRQALTELGHEVLVFCPDLPKVKKKAHVRAFRSWPGLLYPGLRASWPFSMKALTQVGGLDVVHIETPLPVGLLGLRTSRKLDKPTVISAHLDMDFMGEYKIAPLALVGLGFLVALVCRRPGDFIKALFSRRRNPKASRRTDFAWRVYGYFCDQSDVCVAISQKIYNQLELYKEKDNLVLIPNGVNLPVYKLPTKPEARRQLGWADNEFIVISIARLVREKHVELIIESIRHLPGKLKLKLVILGDGPRKSNLQKIVQRYGLSHKVQFYGSVPHKDLHKYIIAADVFVNASLREVASLTVLEAALCAKPLLLFDDKLVEPLEGGVNGFFVNSPDQLAAKIAWLMSKPDKLGSFGAASRKRVKTRYSQSAHGRALSQMYENILKEH